MDNKWQISCPLKCAIYPKEHKSLRNGTFRSQHSSDYAIANRSYAGKRRHILFGAPYRVTNSGKALMNLDQFESRIVDELLKASAPSKHACRSAIRHLERAWILSTSMPELAMFSGITAEEESATALFHVLKKHCYLGANKLKGRNHIHKTALHPFLAAVGKLISQHSDTLNPQFVFDIDNLSNGKERLQLAINIPNQEGGFVRFYPLPPLNLNVFIDNAVYDFVNELEDLASENGAKPIFELIKDRANLRNQLLYAGEQGIPHIKKDVMPFLLDCKAIVFSHFIAFLLIDPYREHQSFVQQSLNAFLKILNRAPQNEFET